MVANVWRIALVCGLLMVGLPDAATTAALAQGSAGQIEGTVRDEQGGAMPGVSLTLRNQATGVARTIVADAEGRYLFAALPRAATPCTPSSPALPPRRSPT